MRVTLVCPSPRLTSLRAAGPALLLSLLAGGCAVSSDKPRECTGKSYTSYLTEIIESAKAYEKRCGILDQNGSRDEERKALFLTSYPSFLTEIRDQAATGKRTGYDSSCFTELLKTAACSASGVSDAVRSCVGREAFGCLTPGRTCQLPEECQNGFCKGILSGSLCGAGVCAPWGGVGAACPEGNVACDSRISFCKAGACQPLEGEGVECDADNQCQTGLVCVRTEITAAVGKCQTPKVAKEGEPCSLVGKVGQSCEAGLSCYKDEMAVYRCQKTIKIGEACRTSEACETSATCARTAVTDATGKCQALGKEGDACSTESGLGQACQITLSCFSFDPMSPAVCQKRPLNNARCALPDLDCLTGVCDTTASPPSCRAKSGAGLSCVSNNDCLSGQCDTTTRKCKEPVCK